MNLPSLVPEPYRLLSRVLMVVLLALALYAVGRYQGAEYVRGQWSIETAELTSKALDAEKIARQREQSMIQQLEKAEHDATVREENLRADATAAATVADGLRHDLAVARGRLSQATAEACRATADTALQLLGTCADEYRSVAAAADGHASDVKTLSDAWPE